LANESAAPHIRTAAGLALKNAFTFRDLAKLREVQERWISGISPEVKAQVKELALKTLASKDARAGQSAAQFIVSIAAIELPRNEWPELMNHLVQSVATGTDQLKQASLITIGFICESQDPELRESLAAHSNAILTAVVQGARREEPNMDIRNAAIKALSDSVDFVRSNMENEGERNYIMQVVCEATQADDLRVQAGAFGCLNRIMGSYYDKMRFYMEKALFGLSIMGMKSEEEDVAKLAIEFWCTVCEEEIAIEDDNAAVRFFPLISLCRTQLTLFSSRPKPRVPPKSARSSTLPVSPAEKSFLSCCNACASRMRMPPKTSTTFHVRLTRPCSFTLSACRVISSSLS
jgi:importin subunit beta-1